MEYKVLKPIPELGISGGLVKSEDLTPSQLYVYIRHQFITEQHQPKKKKSTAKKKTD